MTGQKFPIDTEESFPFKDDDGQRITKIEPPFKWPDPPVDDPPANEAESGDDDGGQSGE